VAASRSDCLVSTGRIAILGVPVDAVGPVEVRSALRDFFAEDWDGRCRHVVTLNPEYVMRARTDAVFAGAIAEADVVTADGVGVVIAARLLDARVGRRVARVTGVDLLDWLAGESGALGAPLYLLGADRGVAAAAAAELSRRHPGARIAGWWSDGTAAPTDDAEALERIRASGARAVAVAYGAPGQVLWIARNQARLADVGVRVAIGVGGALNYLAGRAPWAPVVVRRLGFEWLFRLVAEPWRWRRQVVLPVFASRVGIAWLSGMVHRAGNLTRSR
jgi:N-acetylglucosaminyldiphosphoundecaprenol N-acetyl-beta-D-mannosaminyltransferase